MNKFFIALYDFFESRRTLLYALLGVLVVAMASAALRLRFSCFSRKRKNSTSLLLKISKSIIHKHSSFLSVQYRFCCY